MRRREYSTQAREGRPLDTIAATLAAAARLGPDGRGRLLAPLALQSWPGIIHGGAVIGLLDSAAAAYGLPPRRTIEGRLTSSVPTDTALDVDAHAQDGAVRLTVLQHGQTLASGAVTPFTFDDEKGEPAAWSGGREGRLVPTSEHCLACGTLNPLGLQAALRFDDDGVWVRLSPRPAWRPAGNVVHPSLASVVLDEVAWWLGALTMKEGGLTNRIRVTLVRSEASWAGPLVAAGRFDAVSPVDRKRTFWRTETALTAAGGDTLARASIVFRGGAEYSSRQVPYFRSRAAPDVFRRMFPNHAG